MSAFCWFWRYGTPDVTYSFPYTAQSPTSYKQIHFENMDNVEAEIKEIEQVNAQADKRTIGQDLFYLLPWFAQPEWLSEPWMEEVMYEYQMSQALSIPLASDIYSASAFKLDCYAIITNEINAIERHEADKHGKKQS